MPHLGHLKRLHLPQVVQPGLTSFKSVISRDTPEVIRAQRQRGQRMKKFLGVPEMLGSGS